MKQMFKNLKILNRRMTNLEIHMAKLEEKTQSQLEIQRNHLIRINNNEKLPNEMIYSSRSYNDLSPQAAYEIYQNENKDFIVLDVSEINFTPPYKLKCVINIPFNELKNRHSEIKSKISPILIISENGVKSILACELLGEFGFFNLNNISGGYQFFPEYKTHSISKSA